MSDIFKPLTCGEIAEHLKNTRISDNSIRIHSEYDQDQCAQKYQMSWKFNDKSMFFRQYEFEIVTVDGIPQEVQLTKQEILRRLSNAYLDCRTT